MENQNTRKKIYSKLFLTLFFFLMAGFLTVKAQGSRPAVTAAGKSTKYVLEVALLNTDMDAKRIADVLNGYPEKILSFAADKNTKKVTVTISDKTQIMDVMELMDMSGYRCGFVNEKNEFVQLDANGRMTSRPNDKKQ